MRRLRDTIAVNCPIDRARSRIEQFFAGRGDSGGVVGFVRDGVMCVSWSAQAGVLLPAFAGTLVMWTEGNPKTTFIELDGSYDETLERASVQRTAADLLAEIVAALADSPAAQGIS